MRTLLLVLAMLGTVLADDPPIKMYTIVPGADVLLQDDYGVMLINGGNEEKPVPRYILAIRASRTLVDTRDIRVFEAALRTIPKGTKLIHYDSCTVSRSWGLSEKRQGEFDRVIESAGLVVPEEPSRHTCYCDALERLPRKKNAEAAPSNGDKPPN